MELMVGFLLGGALSLLGVMMGVRIARGSGKEPTSGETEKDRASEEEQRRSHEIEEGIHNLMTFSVNGQDGFDAGGLQ